MRTYNFNAAKLLVIFLLLNSFTVAQRIKDIAFLEGNNSQQIIGYGLVVGLAGTGDSYRSTFTVQSITSMLKRFGITVPQSDLRVRNVAAVMVTATINSYFKPGTKFDVIVSSMGDARSLSGGTLLMTPLSALDGNVYGFAQGPVSIGGYDISTPTGNRIASNHALAGRVPLGGVLDKEIHPTNFDELNQVRIFLKEPDITTCNNVSNAINSKFGSEIAKPLDASEVDVKIPQDKANNVVAFLAELESINVQTDDVAKVVLNERTGTVVAGNNVIIQPVSITHGNLNIIIRSYPIISQPEAFSRGNTAIFNNLVPYVEQDSSKTIALGRASTVQEIASALNSLKVSPKDIISIFQALKEAGALTAELIIM
ncbi:flagellar basal body P-ring protein FlgI [Melioribacteraceae bacterium 4301-Me]|uniref:flagellar basal body P-ring protein FlgI n=1 Tax=Pyranulibacter aquaticus TaxID=3163344 RepID=UPI003595E6E9